MITEKISALTKTELALDNEAEKLDGLGDTQLSNNAINTNLDFNFDNSDVTLATFI